MEFIMLSVHSNGENLSIFHPTIKSKQSQSDSYHRTNSIHGTSHHGHPINSQKWNHCMDQTHAAVADNDCRSNNPTMDAPRNEQDTHTPSSSSSYDLLGLQGGWSRQESKRLIVI